MAVAQTGAIYKAMTIDGESSRTYGVYITGQAVYNAPEREVEMVSVPGRNGQLAIDKGRFENLEVTYPAGIYADTEAEFAEAVSNFRNFLCSRSGYVRIEDEYNPNEYRMGIYKSGLEVETAGHKAGEFEIIFDCKPQRWLKSGETAVTVASGDVVSNPTLFESSPLLEVEGYGNIGINDDELFLSQIDDITVQLLKTKSWDGDSYNLTQTVEFDDSILLTGDRLYSDMMGDAICAFYIRWDYDIQDIRRVIASNTGYAHWGMGQNFSVSFYKSEVEFEYGTSQTFTGTATFELTSTAYGTLTGSISLSLAYDGVHTFTISASYVTPPHVQDEPTKYRHLQFNNMYADATAFSKTYIDLDIGEAYAIVGGELLPYNNKIAFPSDLPTLKAGANTITFDNTITDLKVTPRWWKV